VTSETSIAKANARPGPASRTFTQAKTRKQDIDTNCPSTVLALLLQDSDPDAAQTAANHPGLSRAALAMWQLTQH
jgi:hypothetical protein